jgi:hypothetical protein
MGLCRGSYFGKEAVSRCSNVSPTLSTDISHMHLLAPIASRFPTNVMTLVISFQGRFSLEALSDVVYGSITAIGGDLQCCSHEFGHTSPSGLEKFPFLRTWPWSCRHWCQWREPRDAARDGLERSFGDGRFGQTRRVPRSFLFHPLDPLLYRAIAPITPFVHRVKHSRRISRQLSQMGNPGLQQPRLNARLSQSDTAPHQ